MAHKVAHLAPISISSFSWRRALVLMGFVIVLYGAVPQLGSFKQSLALLRTVNIALLLAGLLATIMTFFVAAFILKFLAFKKLSYSRTVLVQGASGFANRMLPAGLGGLGLNAAYLHRSRHAVAQASTVVLLNNVLGLVGHVVLLGCMLLVVPLDAGFAWPHVSAAFVYVIIVGVVVAGGSLVYLGSRSLSVHRELKNMYSAFAAYTKRPQALAAALAASMVLTASNVEIFSLCAQAVGLHMSFSAMFIAFTLGMAAATVTPTPGGLGGAEAGLTAGLVTYGASADVALAAALLYRLLVYWLPIIPGFVLFDFIIQRKYLG